MSDKARTSFPVAVVCADGELPTAPKLNAIGKQAKSGLSQMEYIVGDVWNMSGDLFLNSLSDNAAALMIPSLARYLGATKHLSPRVPYLPNIDQYTHTITAEEEGEGTTSELRLPYLPNGAVTYESKVDQDYKYLVTSATDFYVNPNTGDLYSGMFAVTGESITYKPVVTGDLGNATFNIIPDPDTNPSYNFGGVKIEYVNGSNDAEGYWIYLPPRMPLQTRVLEGTLPDPQPITENFSSTPTSDPKLFWLEKTQSAPVTQTYGNHYRYALPTIITDNWTTSSIIPTGYCYLWDPIGTKTIIEGLLFYCADANLPWKLKVTGSNLTTWLSTAAGIAAYSGKLTSATHVAADYPDTGLRLITVGSDLSIAFSKLMGDFLNHDHGSMSSLVNRPVPHNSLSGLIFEEGTPRFTPSELLNDDHSMYLERHGYNDSRDRYSNMMLGDLVLASTSNTSDYKNFTSDSNKIVFNKTFGSTIKAVSTESCDLLFWSKNTNAKWIFANNEDQNTDNSYIQLGVDTTTHDTFIRVDEPLTLCLEASSDNVLRNRIHFGVSTDATKPDIVIRPWLSAPSPVGLEFLMAPQGGLDGLHQSSSPLRAGDFTSFGLIGDKSLFDFCGLSIHKVTNTGAADVSWVIKLGRSYDVFDVGAIDPASYVKFTGNTGIAYDGITLAESTASYRIATRSSEWITLALTSPVHEVGWSGKYAAGASYWELTGVTTGILYNDISFWLDNWPQDFTIEGIEVYYYYPDTLGAGNSLSLEVAIPILSGTGVGSGWSEDIIHPIESLGSASAPYWTYHQEDLATHTIKKSNHLLRVSFRAQTDSNSTVLAIRPFIRLKGSYSSVSSFQPIS